MQSYVQSAIYLVCMCVCLFIGIVSNCIGQKRKKKYTEKSCKITNKKRTKSIKIHRIFHFDWINEAKKTTIETTNGKKNQQWNTKLNRVMNTRIHHVDNGFLQLEKMYMMYTLHTVCVHINRLNLFYRFWALQMTVSIELSGKSSIDFLFFVILMWKSSLFCWIVKYFSSSRSNQFSIAKSVFCLY